MTEAILSGVFALVGVIIGGFSSWIIAVYMNKKSRAEKVLEKQQSLSLNMLISLNEMIEKLPKNNDDLIKFKAYLQTEFYPKRNSSVLSEEMLYLTEDIRTTYFVICLYAENDFNTDCDYNVVTEKIVIHRNIFVEMLRDDLKTRFENENIKKKNRRYDKLVNQQIESIKKEQDEYFS